VWDEHDVEDAECEQVEQKELRVANVPLPGVVGDEILEPWIVVRESSAAGFASPPLTCAEVIPFASTAAAKYPPSRIMYSSWKTRSEKLVLVPFPGIPISTNPRSS